MLHLNISKDFWSFWVPRPDISGPWLNNLQEGSLASPFAGGCAQPRDQLLCIVGGWLPELR